MKNKNKILQEVLNHLKNATPEQLEEDWEKIKEWENIGPNAREYIDKTFKSL